MPLTFKIIGNYTPEFTCLVKDGEEFVGVISAISRGDYIAYRVNSFRNGGNAELVHEEITPKAHPITPSQLPDFIEKYLA